MDTRGGAGYDRAGLRTYGRAWLRSNWECRVTKDAGVGVTAGLGSGRTRNQGRGYGRAGLPRNWDYPRPDGSRTGTQGEEQGYKIGPTVAITLYQIRTGHDHF